MRPIALLLLACLLALPVRSESPPILHVMSANIGGLPALYPGASVLIATDLRSESEQRATLTVPVPAGMELASFWSSSGQIAVPDMFPRGTPPAFVTWTGTVSATLPVNLNLNYRVMANAAPGDRALRVTGDVGGVALAETISLRICCVPAPPPVERRFLPVIRR